MQRNKKGNNKIQNRFGLTPRECEWTLWKMRQTVPNSIKRALNYAVKVCKCESKKSRKGEP